MNARKVVDKKGRTNGAVAVDYAGLTTGVRNSPYFDSFIFDGRLASFFTTINHKDNTILAHPLKTNIANAESKNSMWELFRSQSERDMINDVKGSTNDETLVRTISNFKYTSETTGNITFYWRKSNSTGRVWIHATNNTYFRFGLRIWSLRK